MPSDLDIGNIFRRNGKALSRIMRFPAFEEAPQFQEEYILLPLEHQNKQGCPAHYRVCLN